MPLIAYQKNRLTPGRLALIQKANDIITDYRSQGFTMTLRQLYYQLVSKVLIHNNTREYKKLVATINVARLNGLIDWYAIEDRTRYLRGNTHWDSPDQIVQGCVDSYQVDKWENQEYRVEVWIEKDALIGVIEGVCSRNDVPFFSCRGYTSQSEMWNAAQRLMGYGGKTVIIHLGDHDPSGMDMSRDIQDRLSLFMGGDGMVVDVSRIALNRDQVNKYKPPPNPAKLTDSRANVYISEFGKNSWELDALDPKVIDKLIQKAIDKYKDPDLWDEAVDRQEKDIKVLQKVSDKMRKGRKKR